MLAASEIAITILHDSRDCDPFYRPRFRKLKEIRIPTRFHLLPFEKLNPKDVHRKNIVTNIETIISNMS